jgi:hypothetical protein
MKQKLNTGYFYGLSKQPELIPIFLSCIVLIGLLVRDLQFPDSLNEDEKKINVYTQIVLSFISSYVIFLYASYILRPPFSPPIWIYVVTLLVLMLTPFALVVLRLFVKDAAHIQSINIGTILSVLFSMLYTFTAAGG